MTSPSRAGRVQVQVTRDLGLFDVTMAGLGAMLGAGIFVLAGSAARVAESAAWIALGLSAFVALASALAYAELASNRPRAGGGYAWVSEAFSGPSGFFSGWTTWAGHIAAAALSALGVGVFVDYALDTANIPSLPRDVIIGGVPYNLSEKVIGVVVLLGFLGARALAPTASFGRGQVSLAKAILLATFVLFAAVVMLGVPDLPERLLDEPIRFPSLVLAAGVVFIAFQGFEVVAQRAEHVKNPERNVPFGIFLALGLAALVYVSFEIVLLGNVAISPACGGTAWSCLAEGPRAPDLLEPELGSLFAASSISAVAAAFLFAGAIVAMASALVSNMDSGTRTAVSMARDGVLPTSMSHVTERRVPARGLVATGAVAVILLFTLNVEALAIAAAILFLVQYAFVDVALIALRRRTATARGFRAPFVPLASVMAAMLSLALAVSLWSVPAFQPGELLPPGRVAWSFVALWLAAGFVVYLTLRRAAAPRITADVHPDVLDVLAHGETTVDVERYRVFLPLREFSDIALVEFGAAVAKAHDGELSLLHVVEIPRNLPAKAIRFRYVDDRIHGLQRLSRIGMHEGVDTRAVVKIGSKVYEIILDTMHDEAVNLLVMGWRGERVEGDRRIMGSNIDYLVENAPCDLVVFKTRGMRRQLRRIVVLSSRLWALAGVDELAAILAERDRAAIAVVSIAEDPAGAEALKAAARPLVERCRSLGLEIEQKVVYSKAFETTALAEGADADLLVVQASPRTAPRPYALGPVEDRIAKLARCPVLIYRPAPPS